MRTIRHRRTFHAAGSAIIVLAVVVCMTRAAAAESLTFDADELDSFTVDTTELFPRPSDEDVSEPVPVTRLVPAAPADTADPALNLVPLPAPLAPALIGVSVVALRFAFRRRKVSAARVFRRPR
jgi:hypothetical protein